MGIWGGVEFCFLSFERGLLHWVIICFFAKESWMYREVERIWKDLGKGKSIIKTYLNLKIVLNNNAG